MGNVRTEIQHNFLKQIIFRVDFDGIFDADIEKCLLELREDIYSVGFHNMDKRLENHMDFQIKVDLNIPDENRLSINNKMQNTVFRFSSGNQEVLELSKSFFTLTVDVDNKYKTFDKYINILSIVLEKIINISPFFRILRMGLRKINVCFLNDLKDIPLFFTNATFNIGDVLDQFDVCSSIASNMVNLLVKDEYQINFIRNIQEGVMQQSDETEQLVYQVAIDVDVFEDNSEHIQNIIKSKDSIENALIKQNSIAFEMYIKSLNESFIELLKKDDFDCDKIKGVN